MQEQSRSNFNLNARQIIVTYELCPLSLEEAHQQITNQITLNLNRTIEEFIICATDCLVGESTKNIHVWVKLSQKIHCRDSHCLDIQSNGINFTPKFTLKERSNKIVANRCDREVRNYITNIDLWKQQNARESKRSTVCRWIFSEEIPIEQIVDEHPDVGADYKRLKQNFIEYKGDQERRIKKEKQQSLPKYIPNTWVPALLPICHDRSETRRNYWLFSSKGVGKSRWLDELEERFSVYIKRGNEKTYLFWDNYNNEEMIALDDYDLPYLDYAGLKVLTNTKCELRINGGNREVKFKLLVVCSRMSINEMYPGRGAAILQNKFIEYCLDGYAFDDCSQEKIQEIYDYIFSEEGTLDLQFRQQNISLSQESTGEKIMIDYTPAAEENEITIFKTPPSKLQDNDDNNFPNVTTSTNSTRKLVMTTTVSMPSAIRNESQVRSDTDEEVKACKTVKKRLFQEPSKESSHSKQQQKIIDDSFQGKYQSAFPLQQQNNYLPPVGGDQEALNEMEEEVDSDILELKRDLL
jgi:hypothetical protein